MRMRRSCGIGERERRGDEGGGGDRGLSGAEAGAVQDDGLARLGRRAGDALLNQRGAGQIRAIGVSAGDVGSSAAAELEEGGGGGLQ